MKNNMNNSPRDSKLEKFSLEYDPEKVSLPKRQWGWALLLAFLLGIFLGVASIISVTKWRQTHPATVTEPTPKADVIIAGTVDEKALLLVGTDGAFNEIKVASTTTGTFMVQDLTHGRFRALAAALSPQKDHLVYVREEEGHRTAIVIHLGSSNSTIVEKDRLWAAAEGAKIEPCSWSPVAWSPNGARFCFFGCDKATSMLVLVEAETELTPVVIKKTESAQKPPRQVFWLDNDSLLYTHFDASTQQTWVRRIDAHSESVPLSVYGR